MQHWLYKEQFRDGQWFFDCKVVCHCHIKEDHWIERP